ncbi:LOW QUALITY PROTEIN: uncharacterized protein, partial [Amphiura filiformis]|uniref:LOW QUALITY PROTEIN: uncharacterized protein n=1 Tax=Amphiura filiformis TaxID=82378 RepID=UPI003B21438C
KFQDKRASESDKQGHGKRIKGKDYSENEVQALLKFVEANKPLLFGNGGKGSSKEEKVKARTWKKAAIALRAVGGPERDWQKIRKKWRDLAFLGRNYKSPVTGGGPPLAYNKVLEEVSSILAVEAVHGILPEDESMTDSQESQSSTESVHIHVVPTQSTVPPTQSGKKRRNEDKEESTCSSSTPTKTASIRQCEIHEELLNIERAKLAVSQQSAKSLSTIAEVLKQIHNDLNNLQPSAMDLFNSMQ